MGPRAPLVQVLVLMREGTFERMESAVPNPIATSIKIVMGLALVIGLIYIVCFILKRLQENKIGTYGSHEGPIMELISTISFGLGPGKSVHVVRVADRFLVIGATNAGITLLTELDGNSLDIRVRDELAESNELKEVQPGGGRRFDELLAAYTRRFIGRGEMSGGLEDKRDER